MVSNYFTPDDQIIDLGAFRTVGIQCRRLKTQSGAYTIVIQHNSTKDADAWISSTVTFKLDGSDDDFKELTSFSRYLRIQAPSQADGTCVLQIDWIGKE